MRTKTLLLTAAAAIVGTVAASAQSVYSVNAVGYVNVTLPVGFSIIANPLNAATNDIASLLTNLPNLTQYYGWDGKNFQISVYYSDGGWETDYLLPPGSAAWIKNPGTTALTATFVGEVPTGTLTNAIGTGFSLKGSIVPQSAALDTVLGLPVSNLDQVYFWRNGNWDIYTYYTDGGWDPSTPSPAVGEGFWISTTTAKNWVRTFTVN